VGREPMVSGSVRAPVTRVNPAAIGRRSAFAGDAAAGGVPPQRSEGEAVTAPVLPRVSWQRSNLPQQKKS
jgi:hypothetical protein